MSSNLLLTAFTLLPSSNLPLDEGKSWPPLFKITLYKQQAINCNDDALSLSYLTLITSIMSYHHVIIIHCQAMH